MSEVPATLKVGDSWAWEVDLPDYDGATWTLTYYFANVDGAFTIVATSVATLHSVAEVAADTGKTPGWYAWQSRVDDGADDVFTVGEGSVQIEANLLAKGEFRTINRRILDALRATLENRATRDDLQVSIGGKSIARHTMAELRVLEIDYASKVAVEDQGAQAGLGRDIGVRFNRV